MSLDVRALPRLCCTLLLALGLGTAASGQAGPSGQTGAPGQAGAWGRTDATPAAAAQPSTIVTTAQLIGADVRSGDGTVLGPLVDLGIDGRDGTVLFAAIAADRSIGITGRLTAVPIELIDVTPEGLALVGVSRARFAGAPKISPDMWPDASDTVAYAVWAGTVWQYFDKTPGWNIDSAYEPYHSGEREPLSKEEASAERRRTNPQTPEDFAAERASIEANLRNRPEGVRASALGQADLFDGQNQRSGRVRALCIDRRSGRIEYVAVALHGAGGASAGGGDDGVLRPMPWRILNCEYAGDRLYTKLTRAQLDAAPGFPPDAWPDLAAPDWQERLQSSYPLPAPVPTSEPTSAPKPAPADDPRGDAGG